MLGLVQVLDAVLGVLRVVVFIIAAAALVIFTIDWLVRTRRLSPFGAVARFFRRVVDPLIVPIEQPHAARHAVRPAVSFDGTRATSVTAAPLLDEHGNAIRGEVLQQTAWPARRAQPGHSR